MSMTSKIRSEIKEINWSTKEISDLMLFIKISLNMNTS